MNNDITNIHDKSLLIRFTKNAFLIPLVKSLPKWLKPNAITLAGFFSVLLFSYFTQLSNGPFKQGYLLAGIALLLYLIADNIDGMHARNTNQTSPLGGFLDQWLDGISALVITMSLLSIAQVMHNVYLVTILVMAFVNMVLYYDQKNSGSFYKPPFGTNEFLFGIVLFYFVMFTFNVQIDAFCHTAHLKNRNFVAYITIIISLIYIFKSFSKLKMNFGSLVIPVAGHLAVLLPYLLHRIKSPEVIAIMVLMVNAYFIGKMLLTIYPLPKINPFLVQIAPETPGFKAARTRGKKRNVKM